MAASALEEVRRALLVQNFEPADSEELCEEALRCNDAFVSPHMYWASPPPSVAHSSSISVSLGWWCAAQHTVAVLLAVAFALPSARVARAADRLSMA